MGCSAGTLFVKEADVQQFYARLDDIQEHTAQLFEQQAYHSRRLADLEDQIIQTRENSSVAPKLLEQLEAIHTRQLASETKLSSISEAISQLTETVSVRTQKQNSESTLPDETLQNSPKIVIGATEYVRIDPPGVVFPSRIDTGAETSSLDGRDIQIFERDGERWVKFHTPHPVTGEILPMELPLSRKARIYQSSSEESERRPVVELTVTLGRSVQLAEFTLSDRSHLTFPILIGRNVLKDLMIVDVGVSHTLERPEDSSPASSLLPTETPPSDDDEE
jgi:hypothetical protein